jgi:hypothetical protein
MSGSGSQLFPDRFAGGKIRFRRELFAQAL